MEIQEELSELTTSIIDWVITGPPRDQVLEYVRALPESEYITVRYSALVVLDYFFEKIGEDLQVVGSNIATTLPPIDQVEMLTALAKYSSSSVCSNYIKRFPDLVINPAALNYSAWSRKLMQIWYSSISLFIAPKYIQRIVYAHTLLNSTVEPVKRDLVRSVMQSIYDADSRAITDGRELLGSEVTVQSDQLASLKIFPTEFIAKILDPVNYAEKAELLIGFLTSLEIIDAISFEKAVANLEFFDDLVWKQMFDNQLKESLTSFQVNYSVTSPVRQKILNWLTLNWTPSLISSENLEVKTTIFYKTLTLDEQVEFKRTIRVFLNSSPVAELIATPVNVKYMLTRLLGLSGNSVMAMQLILACANDIVDESQRRSMIQMFNVFYKIQNY